ncbi:NAD(P)/FAD-dependent oxidoreductase [Paramicrobacterium chengjingii]|uniref:NAD(P)/FAD-dependent oxidoreductase n=1 Tax=Paramicrobacterium chengjingii TaxID=2769067 RepID=A0ABX6YLV0_9MICO|nr:NAD(P)/FAD-dependent oxidoreductase [Microbacterium chengjingii]QPZ39771.1 NAD(P)/FAD-dependent oxidoreductase [Microbacterium chengjingii]
MTQHYDVVIVGGGPGGLSAALNLVRARMRVLVLDANRPRHSATLFAHGFLTRDNISPLELRRLGREDVSAYENGEVQFATVDAVTSLPDGFRVIASGVKGDPDRDVHTKRIVVATGLAEILPDIGNARAFYGTCLHSCLECDGWEKQDAPLVLIGESDDLAEQAFRALQWTNDLLVLTNGSSVVGTDEERELAQAGIDVERSPIAEIQGARGVMTGIELADGRVLDYRGGFIRPRWHARLGFLDGLGIDIDADGLLVVDDRGRGSRDGVYAAGDITPPGPQQIAVAAGQGAMVSATIVSDDARVRRES